MTIVLTLIIVGLAAYTIYRQLNRLDSRDKRAGNPGEGGGDVGDGVKEQ